MHRKIKLGDVVANPFRDVKRYPLVTSKVEALANSMRETGVWLNLTVRQRGRKYELGPGGHHRVEAARRVLGAQGFVDVDVRELDNDTMIRMLADENLREWGHDFSIEAETVRTVLQAASEGAISLRAHDETRAGRPAKNILAGKNIPDAAIAEFLGRNWTADRVRRCTTALRELGDDVIELAELGPDQATSVLRAARAVAHRQAVERDLNRRESRRLQAVDAKPPEATPQQMRSTVRKLAAGVRAGELTRDDLRAMAGQKTGRGATVHRPRGKQVAPEDFAFKLGFALDAMLATDSVAEGVAQIIDAPDAFESSTLRGLVVALRGVSMRADALAADLAKKGKRHATA